MQLDDVELVLQQNDRITGCDFTVLGGEEMTIYDDTVRELSDKLLSVLSKLSFSILTLDYLTFLVFFF